MQTIRWGIIGCGDVCEVKSGPAFQKAAGSALTAVMRRDAAKAADFARRHNVPKWYDNADALINDKNVDAVYIATPPGTHELYALKVAAAGKPCYVEKPMARNAAEARRMKEAFQKANLPLFVAYYRRAMPRFLKVKEILDSGVLGDDPAIGYVYEDQQCLKRNQPVPWRLEPEFAGGGLLLDLGSHAIDLMDFFVGTLTPWKGEARNIFKEYEVEDHVSFTLITPKKTLTVMNWNFSAEKNDDRFLFTGENGTMQVSCFGNEPITVKYNDGRTESFDIPKPAHVHQPLVQTIVDELLGRGKALSTADNGLRCQEIMDAALTDYYGGREDNFWSRPWPGASK